MSKVVFLPLRDDAPHPRRAVATASILLLNLVVFIVQTCLPAELSNRLLYAAGAIPWEIVRLTDLDHGAYQTTALVPPPFTVLTAMFLHGNIEHLAGNLWFLWVFGRGVEAAMGAWRFVAFYLAGGVVASLAQVFFTPDATTPIVGASGAIAAVLGAYLALHPTARLELLVFLVVILQIVVVPAVVGLGVWLVWQVLANRGSLAVAGWAHIGGFVAGLAMCKLFARRSWTAPLAPVSSSSPR